MESDSRDIPSPPEPPTGQGMTGEGPAPSGGPPSKDACTMAMLAHLLGIFTGFIGALIIWMVKKEDPFVDDQGKEALNFQLTLLIGYVIGVVTSCIVIGWLILPALYVVNIIFCILGTVAANNGQKYRYPFNLRMVK